MIVSAAVGSVLIWQLVYSCIIAVSWNRSTCRITSSEYYGQQCSRHSCIDVYSIGASCPAPLGRIVNVTEKGDKFDIVGVARDFYWTENSGKIQSIFVASILPGVIGSAALLLFVVMIFFVSLRRYFLLNNVTNNLIGNHKNRPKE